MEKNYFKEIGRLKNISKFKSKLLFVCLAFIAFETYLLVKHSQYTDDILSEVLLYQVEKNKQESKKKKPEFGVLPYFEQNLDSLIAENAKYAEELDSVIKECDKDIKVLVEKRDLYKSSYCLSFNDSTELKKHLSDLDDLYMKKHLYSSAFMKTMKMMNDNIKLSEFKKSIKERRIET